MKQLLELVIQDDGTLDLKCHNEELADKVLSKKPKVYKKQMKNMISKMVKIMWGDKNTGMSKLIRFLSMTEMCACAEPYSQAEELWSTMMFSLIPLLEDYLKQEKQKYANYSGAKQKPISFGNTSMFNLNAAFGKRYN
ncbi:MAG: hypothetical protein K5909_02265 [Bacteroidales bacterium]|nr:hypothetical protein [Bacteroidales bacterium]